VRIPIRPAGTLWGLIDETGAVVVEPRFATLKPFAEGLALAGLPGEPLGTIDEDGAWAIEPGRVPFGPYSGPFSEGLAQVQVRGRWGYVDTQGEWVVEPTYERADPFREGLASVRKGETQYGWIDRSGAEAIPFRFDVADSFHEGVARASLPGQSGWSYVDRQGEVVIPGPYGSADCARGGRIAVLDPRADAWGYLDLQGEVAIPPVFRSARSFSEGLAAVRPPDGRWGYLDPQGTFAIAPRFSDVGPFADGLARANEGWGWGYIDPQGEWVIAPQLAAATDFAEGRARVSFRDVELVRAPEPDAALQAEAAASDNPLLKAIVANAGKDPFLNGNYGVIDRAGQVLWPAVPGLALKSVAEVAAARAQPPAQPPETPASAAALHAALLGDAQRIEHRAAGEDRLAELTWARALRHPALWLGVVAGALFGWFHGMQLVFELSLPPQLLPPSLLFGGLGLLGGRALAGLSVEAGGLGAVCLRLSSLLGAVGAALVGNLVYPTFDPLGLGGFPSPVALFAFGLIGLWFGRVGGLLLDDMTPASRRTLLTALGVLGAISLALALLLTQVLDRPPLPRVLLLLALAAAVFLGGPLWLGTAKPRPGLPAHATYLAALMFGRSEAIGFGSIEAEERERSKRRAAARGFQGVVAALGVTLLLLLVPWAVLLPVGG